MSKCDFNKVAFQFCQYHCGHVIHEVKFLHNLSKAIWHHVQNFKKKQFSLKAAAAETSREKLFQSSWYLQSIPTFYVFMIYFLWKEQPN